MVKAIDWKFAAVYFGALFVFGGVAAVGV